MPQPSARDRFLELLRPAVLDGTLVKLTLGKPRTTQGTLKNVFIRPVTLKTGPHFAFVWRHDTRDITKNLSPDDALASVSEMLGTDFLDAHLFTPTQHAQFESAADGKSRLRTTRVDPSTATSAPTASDSHDRSKTHLVPAQAPWLRALGVTNDRGQPREGMADKFRQIQKFAELLTHLFDEAFPSPESGDAASAPLRLIDMGSGKGYLTFALAEVFRSRVTVRGVEARQELVDLCNRVARDTGLAPVLSFTAGSIASTPIDACDVLIALHACDTATDDALARGVAAGARLLVVAPCCQKELRRQLTAPPVLADALRHGIFQERQAEFVTDALRAQLLQWAGYRTKVFEFISTEHTAKNLMIAAIKDSGEAANNTAVAERIRAFAAFYGIRDQQLAAALQFDLRSAAISRDRKTS